MRCLVFGELLEKRSRLLEKSIGGMLAISRQLLLNLQSKHVMVKANKFAITPR